MDDSAAAGVVFILGLTLIIGVGLRIQKSLGPPDDDGNSPPSSPVPGVDSEVLERRTRIRPMS